MGYYRTFYAQSDGDLEIWPRGHFRGHMRSFGFRTDILCLRRSNLDKCHKTEHLELLKANPMVTSKFDLEVIFEVKWGHLAFGQIFSAKEGRIWTHFIKHNIWNFLIPILWWPQNVTSRSFSRSNEVIFNLFYYFFQNPNLDKWNNFKQKTKNTKTSWTSSFLL